MQLGSNPGDCFFKAPTVCFLMHLEQLQPWLLDISPYAWWTSSLYSKGFYDIVRDERE